MTGKIILIGSNKCPICGKEFKPTPPLRPNTEDREFYGGRIKFFKQVTCVCTAEYDLCIEKRYDPLKQEEVLNVINMILLKEGMKKDDLRRAREKEDSERPPVDASQMIAEAIEEKKKRSTLASRLEEKKQNILATVIDKDAKVRTLMLHTTHELQMMCKRRKVKYSVKDTKPELAEKLLAHDPTMVVANPQG